ncbi:MAG TPA: MFS transporter [Candidatus Sericytochromatia bacterium]
MIMLNFYSQLLGVASTPVAKQVDIPENMLILFSPPQFFVALIAGVLMAFAFQFLLTNLSIAVGISSDGDVIDTDVDDDQPVAWSKAIRKVEGIIGVWTLFTINIALFTAAFLAVKLSLIGSPGLGAIVGVVIWSVFFLLLVWLSSSAVGSLFGSVVNTATSGMQGVMSTAATALGGSAVNKQIVNTVEASVAAVRRELGSAVDPDSIRETVDSYFQNLQAPQLNLSEIRSNFDKLLNDQQVQSLASSAIAGNINRQTFVDLVSSRSDLSKQDIQGIADQLEAAWNNVVKQQPQQTIDQGREALTSGSEGKQLDETLYQGESSQQSGVVERVVQAGTTALVGATLNRLNLSNIDVNQVSGQLQQLAGQASDQVQKLGSQVGDKLPGLNNAIATDVENYILNTQPWHLNRETIKQEFKDVIYDAEASAGFVRPLLEQINRESFVQFLNKRGDFSEERVVEIADQLEEIRTEVLETVKSSESQEQSQDLRSRVEDYLRSTGKEELNPEGIERDFIKLLEDPQAGVEVLQSRFSQFDRDSLVQILSQREDFSQEEADQLVGNLESTRDRILSQAQELQDHAKSQVEQVFSKVEDYLRNTNKDELNPDAIKQDLQTLVEDPKAGLQALRERLSHFDRDTLMQLLTARGDLSEDQINQFIDQFGSVRDNILNAPQKVADTAKEQYEQLISKISEYLGNTNLEELNPDGIKQDLTTLLQDPKEGASALRQRLSQVDRETLVKLLSQREDLSEEKVNQIIDQVQDSINSIVKAPRRLASRTKETVKDFSANLESYLRNTNKDELNPDSIKRDLQLLINDPKSGMQSIGDRLSHFNRDTLIALLSQREDISEEEANRIADQIISGRDSLLEQVHKVQDTMQSVMDGTFGKIRDYLNSLNRPELNYEGIKHDFRKVFDDPEAGFDALKERLSQFDRDSLVAVLSSRQDISEEDANRIVHQIEDARDSVLKRAERLQETAKKRIKEIKHQAKKQGEEARKAAATAAWWLFGTATTSLITAALAGAIAVGGFNLLG